VAITLLHRIDNGRNMARSYELSVQPGLFGDVAVTRHWGRIGTAGQTRECWFDTEDAASKEAGIILQQKVRRGYQIKSIEEYVALPSL
jgi:predicted DNA-binding WGR domain protein